MEKLLKSVFRRFKREDEGAIIQYVVLIAVIGIIIALVAPKLNFFIQHAGLISTHNIDYAIGNADEPVFVVDEHDPSSCLIGREISGYIQTVRLQLTENGPFYFGKNDTFGIRAEPVSRQGYQPKPPFRCVWQGYEAYSGSSCDAAPLSTLGVGEHTVRVKLCDALGACASERLTFEVIYRDPMAVIHEEWTNETFTGGNSGKWQYDEANNTIHTTQNVGFTAYTNPNDEGLRDYRLSFSMGVENPLSFADDDAIGFIFRHTDKNNMYVLSIDNREGYGGGVGGYHSGLYRWKDGKKTKIYDLMPLRWEHGEFMDVVIDVKGDRIMVDIDGQRVIDMIDSNPLRNGSYGPMTISQAYGKFKNLDVQIY